MLFFKQLFLSICFSCKIFKMHFAIFLSCHTFFRKYFSFSLDPFGFCSKNFSSQKNISLSLLFLLNLFSLCVSSLHVCSPCCLLFVVLSMFFFSFCFSDSLFCFFFFANQFFYLLLKNFLIFFHLFISFCKTFFCSIPFLFHSFYHFFFSILCFRTR